MHSSALRRGAVALAGFMIAFTGFVIVAPGASASSVWFVATPAAGGNDAHACTSASPCASLARAVSVSAAGDTIRIGAGTFPTNVDLESDPNRTIIGAGEHTTFLDGGGTGTVLQAAEAPSTTTITDLTVQHGNGTGRLRVPGGIVVGNGDLVLTRVAVVNNTGNGVDNEVGDVVMTDSTVSGNSGGLLNFEGGVTVSNSTFNGNQNGIEDQSCCSHFTQVTVAGNTFDGIATGNTGVPNISSSTIANNGGVGLALGNLIGPAPTSAFVDSTIIAGNAGGNCAFSTASFPAPPLTDVGYNLESDAGAACGFSNAHHDLVGVNPQLGPLGANGGPTPTMVPVWRSAVIDVVPYPITLNSRTVCPGRDPRGVARPQGLKCDIGAVEKITPLAPAAPAAPSVAPLPTGVRLSFSAPANGGTPITGYMAICRSSNGGNIGLGTGATTPLTVNALTTGKTYTCTVAATNAIGTGPASAPSASVIVGTPAAPAMPTVSRTAAGQLRVTFVAPADNGSPITQYSATCLSTNGGVAQTATGTTSPIAVTALTATKTYRCTVKARNARGFGPTSAASKATVA